MPGVAVSRIPTADNYSLSRARTCESGDKPQTRRRVDTTPSETSVVQLVVLRHLLCPLHRKRIPAHIPVLVGRSSGRRTHYCRDERSLTPSACSSLHSGRAAVAAAASAAAAASRQLAGVLLSVRQTEPSVVGLREALTHCGSIFNYTVGNLLLCLLAFQSFPLAASFCPPAELAFSYTVKLLIVLRDAHDRVFPSLEIPFHSCSKWYSRPRRCPKWPLIDIVNDAESHALQVLRMTSLS